MKTAEFLWFIKSLLCSGTVAHKSNHFKKTSLLLPGTGDGDQWSPCPQRTPSLERSQTSTQLQKLP